MNSPEQDGSTVPAKDAKVRFDMTLNLGHVLTIIAFALTAMVSWNVMDKRVLVLEEFKIGQRDKDMAQDTATKEKFQEVRDSLNDLRRSVEKVADKVGAK